MAGALEDVGREGFAADILAAGTDFIEGAASRYEVALQHLKVAVLLAGVLDECTADWEELGRDAGGGAGDPTRAVYYLLAQVEDKSTIVLKGNVPGIELLQKRDTLQAVFEIEPDEREFADQLLGQRVGARLQLWGPGTNRRGGRLGCSTPEATVRSM